MRARTRGAIGAGVLATVVLLAPMSAGTAVAAPPGHPADLPSGLVDPGHPGVAQGRGVDPPGRTEPSGRARGHEHTVPNSPHAAARASEVDRGRPGQGVEAASIGASPAPAPTSSPVEPSPAEPIAVAQAAPVDPSTSPALAGSVVDDHAAVSPTARPAPPDVVEPARAPAPAAPRHRVFVPKAVHDLAAMIGDLPTTVLGPDSTALVLDLTPLLLAVLGAYLVLQRAFGLGRLPMAVEVPAGDRHRYDL